MITQLNLSLNGEWRLALDPSDVGTAERWFDSKDLSDALTVRVPNVWDLWVPDYDGVGWYFREFELGPGWQGQFIQLHFNAVDYYAEVWLNGTHIGEHEGGYTPFSLNASDAVLEGQNRLAVRVIDPHGPNGYGKFKPKQIPCAKEEGYWSFAGIWGDVRVSAKSHTNISDVFIEPDLRRKRIGVTVETSMPGMVRLAIEGTPFEVLGQPEKLRVDFPEFESWSPSNPKLYTLTTELIVDEEVVDRVQTRFGMREFGIKENCFFLNNHPLFIKGVLHQPDYARSLAAPESEAIARKELEAAKAAGFNLVRLHIKPAPKITLDLADELGLLLYEEPPIGWIEDSPWMQKRCEREVREMILRDRNHPSVVIWGMLNETGNAGYETHGGAQQIKDDLCRLARSLDPSRVIIDDSGGVNATREPARFMRPYHDELEPYDDLHIYQRAPVDRDIESYYMNNGDPERLYFLSEFGFGGMEDLADVIEQYGEPPLVPKSLVPNFPVGNVTAPEAPLQVQSEIKAELLPQGRSQIEIWERGPGFKDARFLAKMLEAAQTGFAERNLDRVFGDFSGFTEAARQLQADAIRFQVDACRANLKLAGYCYTQLCDAGHEFCAGMLDRWRRPKPALEALRQAQQPMRPIIQMARTNLVPREEVPVSIGMINEERSEARVDLSLQVVGPTNQVLWKKKRAVKLVKTGKELWGGTVGASGSGGTHRFVVRVMQGMKCLGENSLELFVVEPVDPCDVEINVLDPQQQWAKACLTLAKPGNVNAPIHIIPPLANTIRAYPDNELAQILAQVKGGAVALFFEPPDDWNDLADRIDPAIRATSKDAVGGFLGVYHYAKLHPVFDGLPARGLMRQPYRNVLPAKTFLENSDEDICGTFDTAPIAGGKYGDVVAQASCLPEQECQEDAGRMPALQQVSPCWGSDILVRRHGSGRIVFTHLRVLENLGEDPVVDCLFVNILKHFSRRSVPTERPMPLDQKAVEWLRRERNEQARRWMVIGPFPNWGGKGHAMAYPPEKETVPLTDFTGTYPGWYQAVQWKTWQSLARNGHWVDLQEAFTPVYEYYPRFDYGTGYAYAEFTADKRQTATMKIGIQDAMKIWLNGRLVHESLNQVPHDQTLSESESCTLKQGRNSLLVKVSKIPGPFKFAVDFESDTAESLQIKWWK